MFYGNTVKVSWKWKCWDDPEAVVASQSSGVGRVGVDTPQRRPGGDRD